MVNTDYIPTVNIWEQSFDSGNSYPFTDGFTSYSGTREGRLPTKEHKLERAFKYNAGVDAVMFKLNGVTTFMCRKEDVILLF